MWKRFNNLYARKPGLSTTHTLTDHLAKQPPDTQWRTSVPFCFAYPKGVIHNRRCGRIGSDRTAWDLQGVIVNVFVSAVADIDKCDILSALSQTTNATWQQG